MAETPVVGAHPALDLYRKQMFLGTVVRLRKGAQHQCSSAGNAPPDEPEGKRIAKKLRGIMGLLSALTAILEETVGGWFVVILIAAALIVGYLAFR
jgi:hypothetical protein